MDVKEFIRRQLGGARRQSDAAMQGTTEEQLNWVPPGAANQISATFLHIVGGEDIFVQTLLQGKPSRSRHFLIVSSLISMPNRRFTSCSLTDTGFFPVLPG